MLIPAQPEQPSGASYAVKASLVPVDQHVIEELRRSGPLFTHAVQAGFPSPADDYIEERINLDEYLVARPEATFFLRVAGDSMQGMGIQDGDLLVIDRSVTAAPGHVVIAVVNGELTVKQLVRTADGHALRAAHPAYPDIPIDSGQELHIWGVARWAIHKIGS